MSNTALIVIDMQTGLLEDKNNPIFNEKQLIHNVNSLILKARDADATVIFVRHTESEGPLQIHRPGWQISSEIKMYNDDIIINKYTPDSFYQTILEDILKKLNVTKLVIAGLQSEYCIDTTCRRAFTMGYDTVLISDAHSTCNSPLLSAETIIDHHNHTLSNGFVKLCDHRQADFM